MKNCIFSEKKNPCHYYLTFVDFYDDRVMSQGILSFCFDHPFVSAHDWLIWAYDICLDHSTATLFISSTDGFDRTTSDPVFFYHDDQGYIMNFPGHRFSPVADPAHEEYDIFFDSYDAYVHAARVSTIDDNGCPVIFKSQIDKKFLKEGVKDE